MKAALFLFIEEVKPLKVRANNVIKKMSFQYVFIADECILSLVLIIFLFA